MSFVWGATRITTVIVAAVTLRAAPYICDLEGALPSIVAVDAIVDATTIDRTAAVLVVAMFFSTTPVANALLHDCLLLFSICYD